MARKGLRPSARKGELVLASRGVDLVRLHIGQTRRLLRRRRPDLDPHQLRGYRFAQIGAHALEQAERFRLVLVERIALAIAAQPDYLAQMFEHDQVLAPEVVERLQKDRLLDV